MKTKKNAVLFITILLMFFLSYYFGIYKKNESESTGNQVDLSANPRTTGYSEEEPRNAFVELDVESRFDVWKSKLQSPVEFVHQPVVDKEGIFYVVNPEYIFQGKRLVETVEDGYWYHHAMTGPRGAILFGKGNGRPPWSYKVAELYIENNELKLSHRISFGGNKGVRTRLLIDTDEKFKLTKIGIVFDEIVPDTPWGYPPIIIDDVVIDGDKVGKTPLTSIKSNWMQLDTDFKPSEITQEPARIIWLQFQNEGKDIKVINN